MPEEKTPLILLIDDDEQLCDLYSTKLKHSGFRVSVARNGADGFNLAKELQPDLILMDYEMPVMNGIEALVRLKENPTTAKLKVVFLTAFGDPRTENRVATDTKFAKDVGALDYIRKGVDLDELVARIRGYLANPR